MRRIETLPDEQVYQVLDYIEFLESKYAEAGTAEASGLQKFAENITDKMRKKAMNPEKAMLCCNKIGVRLIITTVDVMILIGKMMKHTMIFGWTIALIFGVDFRLADAFKMKRL